MYVVRHQIEGTYDLKNAAEKLSDKELEFISCYPSENQYCSECKEFSTRIDKNGKCRDCNDKEEY